MTRFYETILEEFIKEKDNFPITPFDAEEFDVKVTGHGGQLRNNLIDIQNLQGRLNELANKAETLSEKARLKAEEAKELATYLINESSYRNTKGDLKKHLIRNQEVQLLGDKKKTTYLVEARKVIVYDYLKIRAKAKVKEIDSAIATGRSALAWDREEIKNLNI